MPATLSLAVASILFLWIYNPLAGPLSIVLSWFDVESPRWFKENWLVIFAICTIIGWKVFGYNLIVMLAATATEAIMELHLEHPMLLVTGEDMQQRSVVQMGSYTL